MESSGLTPGCNSNPIPSFALYSTYSFRTTSADSLTWRTLQRTVPVEAKERWKRECRSCKRCVMTGNITLEKNGKRATTRENINI
ncbi:hypothetical protein Pcinc_004900 [Petrolisthes cinctipes]|uniref:Uncharacterized protein n=1 Tax=Petrolisthes cinctipes TaxID=88211 RepID=A0AAE1GG44_PETCI|nr:hypothetical protein Pcinc_004900 [Petrolisthes cinctipes]